LILRSFEPGDGAVLADGINVADIKMSCLRARVPIIPQDVIHWDEQQDTVTWKSCSSGYFKGREKHFSPLDFIAQLTLHIPRAAVTRSVTVAPPRGRHLVRRYGLYSSRARGTWKDRPALCTRAPLHWYGREAVEPPTPTGTPKDQAQGGPLHGHLSTLSSRKAWADGSDRCHSRSRRDFKNHCVSCQARSWAADGGVIGRMI
jgi:hypothetical protein